jgi:hypothetical protein
MIAPNSTELCAAPGERGFTDAKGPVAHYTATINVVDFPRNARAGQIQQRRRLSDADVPTAHSQGWLASCEPLRVKRSRTTPSFSSELSEDKKLP